MKNRNEHVLLIRMLLWIRMRLRLQPMMGMPMVMMMVMAIVMLILPGISFPDHQVNAQAGGQADEQIMTESAREGDGNETLSTPEIFRGTYPQLREYMRQALEQNPELQALDHMYRSEAERSREAGILDDPELGISYDFNPMMSESVAGRFSVSVMQMFPWFGTLGARRDIQMAMADAGRADIELRRLELLGEIRKSWFDIAVVHHHIHLMYENLQLVQDLAVLVQVRYETGRAGQADILRIQMEEQRLRTRIADFEDMLNPLTASFNVLLNRDQQAEVLTTEVFEVMDVPWSEAQVREQARMMNPVFENLQARETAMRVRERLSRLEGRPTFGLGLEVMGRDFGPMSMNPDATESFIGMATVRVPVFRGRTRSQQRQIGEELNALERQREQAVNTLDAGLESALEQIRRAEREVRLLKEELLPRAQQAMNILREEYASGNVRFDELLQIQRELLELDMERVEALAAQNRAVIRLETLMGLDGLENSLSARTP